MMGSFLIFSALAIVMYSTRNINWYQVGEEFAVKSNKTKEEEDQPKDSEDEIRIKID